MGMVVAGFIVAVLACACFIVVGMALALRDMDDAYDWDDDL